MSVQQLSRSEMRIRSLNLQFITSLVIILSIVKLHKQLSNLGKKKSRNIALKSSLSEEKNEYYFEIEPHSFAISFPGI